MPRTYIRKGSGPAYTNEDIISAVNEIKNKSISYRKAQEKYGVPISVIYHRIKGRKVALDKYGRVGRPNVLTRDIEIEIVNCIVARAQMGYPVEKQELKNVIGEYVIANNIETPFRNGIPGEDWCKAFMRRNPSVSLKIIQKSEKASSNPEIIYHFFDKLKRHHLSTLENANFNKDDADSGYEPSRVIDKKS